MTITAAMTPKPPEEQSSDTAGVVNLWSVKNIYDCNFWFLGVEQAMEITESYKEPDERNRGESFNAEVKVPGHVTTLTTVRRPRPHSSGLVCCAQVIQVTLESGLGHQTVPLLLAESSFTGAAKNWSSMLEVKANMTLEVSHT